MADTTLVFSHTPLSSHVMKGVVTASSEIVATIREQITHLYTDSKTLPRASENKLPLEYVQTYFAKEINHDLQNFIFKHFVLNFLMKSLTKHKMIITSWPRLSDVITNKDNDSVSYEFTFSQAPEIPLKEWKHFVFKSPQRKNYKDLDNQVTTFIKTETSLYKKQEKTLAQGGDWVHLEVAFLDENHNEIIPQAPQQYWMHLAEQHLSNSLQEACMNRNEGDVLMLKSFPFVSSTQENFDEPFLYKVTIQRIVKGNHLSLEFFKNAFRLRTRADVHAKLIEVFSYRNDVSQRRSIIEELFHLLFTKHRFEIPKHIVTRKKELLLEDLKRQPDYHVYKSHRNFQSHIEQLAEKMAKEEILIDRIAYTDGITVTADDVAQYLHLITNQRLREFVYFKPLIDSLEETDTPLHEGIIEQAVLREKTLNHVIYNLL